MSCIDATYLKVRRGARIVSVAAIIAVGVNADGYDVTIVHIPKDKIS